MSSANPNAQIEANLLEAKGRYASAGNTLQDIGGELKTITGNLQASWLGPASDAYQQKLSQLTATVEKASTVMQQGSTQIGKMHDAYVEADEKQKQVQEGFQIFMDVFMIVTALLGVVAPFLEAADVAFEAGMGALDVTEDVADVADVVEEVSNLGDVVEMDTFDVSEDVGDVVGYNVDGDFGTADMQAFDAPEDVGPTDEVTSSVEEGPADQEPYVSHDWEITDSGDLWEDPPTDLNEEPTDLSEEPTDSGEGPAKRKWSTDDEFSDDQPPSKVPRTDSPSDTQPPPGTEEPVSELEYIDDASETSTDATSVASEDIAEAEEYVDTEAESAAHKYAAEYAENAVDQYKEEAGIEDGEVLPDEVYEELDKVYEKAYNKALEEYDNFGEGPSGTSN
jgi:WXG100 family type VII secretion target